MSIKISDLVRSDNHLEIKDTCDKSFLCHKLVLWNGEDANAMYLTTDDLKHIADDIYRYLNKDTSICCNSSAAASLETIKVDIKRLYDNLNRLEKRFMMRGYRI